MTPSSNLSLTVAHVISFLTGPLIASYPASAIRKLQVALEANLTALYAPTWVTKDPLPGSRHRCLSLSPERLPPRPIYSACIAAGVQWFEWFSFLGNQEFDLFVDPGCISVRYGAKEKTSDGKLFTIWLDQTLSPPTRAANHLLTQARRDARMEFGTRPENSKTLAQQLLEDDHQADDQLFAMIADELNAPTWMTPVDAHFPPTVRPISPFSATSVHSRCSSRSSNSSSGFSYTSAQSSATSASLTSTSESGERKQSRREKARQARVFVDTSKVEVTPYDGGKTTVLTGGVMLGATRRGDLKTNKAAKHMW